VHGGGFYHPVKYAVRRRKLPDAPALVLLGKLQHLAVRLRAVHRVLPLECQHLPDRQATSWTGRRAPPSAWPLSFLVVFWMLYDAICRIFGQRKNGDAIVGALVLCWCASPWLACHWFAGRAAFLLVGAMIATAMSANVFFWIIPGQRKVVAAIKAGEPVDPVHGQRGKQRSVHNTYFTLPVLFAMLSNH
jgi:uncharacterized membrane protein